MKKIVLLSTLALLESVILSSCEGWVYMDNPVLEDSKSAKDAAAEALIGSWKNVPKNHRHENYESKDFLVILGNGRIKSNLYGKTDFKESVYTLDSDWLFYPNDSSLSGHLYTDIIPGGNQFRVSIKGSDMILAPDAGIYPNDPTRYFEREE